MDLTINSWHFLDCILLVTFIEYAYLLLKQHNYSEIEFLKI